MYEWIVPIQTYRSVTLATFLTNEKTPKQFGTSENFNSTELFEIMPKVVF